MDGPVRHPSIADVLLNDWNDPTFNAYRDMDDKWVADQGFVRFVDLSKGNMNRIYAQLAVQFVKNEPKWVPFIFDTGAPASFMSKEMMIRLGVPVNACGFTGSANFSCGTMGFTAGVSCGGTTASKDSLDKVNLIGMTELKNHTRPMWESLIKAIGSPSVPSFVWVQVLHADQTATNVTAFKVVPTSNDVDALKDAIQKKRKEAGETLDPLHMKVSMYDPAKKQWVEVIKPDTPLIPNSVDTAYHVAVTK
jgi:hypothetical protein